jgi:hypothetical protein
MRKKPSVFIDLGKHFFGSQNKKRYQSENTKGTIEIPLPVKGWYLGTRDNNIFANINIGFEEHVYKRNPSQKPNVKE